MDNTYKKVRLEPRVVTMDVGGTSKDNVVVHLVVGVTVSSDDGYEEYHDEKLILPPPDPANFIEFKTLCEDADCKWQNEIADKHIEENNWHAVLDKMLEAKRAKPLTRSWVWEETTVEPSA